MHFNPEINLGTIIEILVFLGAIYGAIRKVTVLETKLNIMYGWFEETVMHPRKNDSKRFFGGSE